MSRSLELCRQFMATFEGCTVPAAQGSRRIPLGELNAAIELSRAYDDLCAEVKADLVRVAQKHGRKVEANRAQGGFEFVVKPGESLHWYEGCAWIMNCDDESYPSKRLAALERLGIILGFLQEPVPCGTPFPKHQANEPGRQKPLCRYQAGDSFDASFLATIESALRLLELDEADGVTDKDSPAKMTVEGRTAVAAQARRLADEIEDFPSSSRYPDELLPGERINEWTIAVRSGLPALRELSGACTDKGAADIHRAVDDLLAEAEKLGNSFSVSAWLGRSERLRSLAGKVAKTLRGWADQFESAGDVLSSGQDAAKRRGEPRTEADTPTPVQPTHNADFTMVIWDGTEYHFALGVQSRAVQALWTEWEKTGLGLHQDTIRSTVDEERNSFRMDKAFRNHPAFGTMIRGTGDGRYKLSPPGEQLAAPAAKIKKSARIPSKARRKPR